MTLNDLTQMAARYPLLILSVFALLPGVAFILPKIHGKNIVLARSPWRFLYMLIIYSVCFPGILSSVLVAYSMFFVKSNLLNVNILIYFLPIISMGVTLIFFARSISFDDIPGFDRIYGFMVMIGIIFVFVLILEKTRIWLFFGGSMFMLIAIVIALFALLKWGGYMLFRKKDEPTRKPPKFPYQ